MTVEARLGTAGGGLILFAPFLVGDLGPTTGELLAALAPGAILLMLASWKASVRGFRAAEAVAAPPVERFSRGILDALPWLALLLLLLAPVLFLMSLADHGLAVPP